MSDDRVNPPYQTDNSRVYGQGMSINCTNKITATELCNKLNNYETTIHQLETQIQHDKNYEKLQQYLIALQMDISNIQADLNKIKELLE